MKAALFSLSLRARLLLAGTLAQVVMLVLLIANGISIIDSKLNERTGVHLAEQKQLLNAVLAPQLAQADRDSAQRLLDSVRRDNGIAYLVLSDRQGEIFAASGWDSSRPLPPVEADLRGQLGKHEGRFDTELDIEAGGMKLGKLRFGLSTGFMQTARDELVRDNLMIGGIALAFSVLLMVALSYWLTRSLTRLTDASASLAAGDLHVRLPITGSDEVGKLTYAFNAMAAALQGRIEALAESEAKFTTIADYSYDCELWIGSEGSLIWINPRVQDMFGYTPEECIGTTNFPAPFISESDIGRTVREIRPATAARTMSSVRGARTVPSSGPLPTGGRFTTAAAAIAASASVFVTSPSARRRSNGWKPRCPNCARRSRSSRNTLRAPRTSMRG
jgi:PAS domain S-box-containing protein